SPSESAVAASWLSVYAISPGSAALPAECSSRSDSSYFDIAARRESIAPVARRSSASPHSFLTSLRLWPGVIGAVPDLGPASGSVSDSGDKFGRDERSPEPPALDEAGGVSRPVGGRGAGRSCAAAEAYMAKRTNRVRTEWGMGNRGRGDRGTRGQGEENSFFPCLLVSLSPCLLFTLPIPHLFPLISIISTSLYLTEA